MNKIITILLLFVPCLAFGQGGTPNLRNPKAYYRFERTTGSVIEEKGDFDATNNGATRGSTGIKGNAFTFNGSSDNVTPGAVLLPTDGSPWSVSLWGRPGLLSGSNPAFTQYSSTGTGRCQIYVLNTDWKVFIDDITDTNITIGTALLDTWQHVVVTYDGTTLRTYLDGTAGPTDATVNNIESINSGIGSGIGGSINYYDGLIDELMVYPRALSVLEKDQLYQQGNGLLFVENFKKDKNYEKLINYVLGDMYFGFIASAN